MIEMHFLGRMGSYLHLDPGGLQSRRGRSMKRLLGRRVVSGLELPGLVGHQSWIGREPVDGSLGHGRLTRCGRALRREER